MIRLMEFALAALAVAWLCLLWGVPEMARTMALISAVLAGCSLYLLRKKA